MNNIDILENMIKNNGILEGGFQEFERQAISTLISENKELKKENLALLAELYDLSTKYNDLEANYENLKKD